LENKKTFTIEVKNYNKDHFFVQSAMLNGKIINRNWLTQQEIQAGGTLIIETEQNQIYYGELRTNGFQIAVNNLNNYF
jgi:putative alpha-1,2-mannosidase